MTDQPTTTATMARTELRERLCAALANTCDRFTERWAALRTDRELRLVLLFPAAVLAVLAIALIHYANQDDTANAAPAVPAVAIAPPAAAREQRPTETNTQTQQRTGPPTLPDHTYRTYRVARGDTLASIALRHGVDYQRIAEVNQLTDTHRIHSGQLLRIGTSTPGTVLIHPGDTLTTIAATTGLTVARLRTLNPWITNPNRIPAGAGLRTHP